MKAGMVRAPETWSRIERKMLAAYTESKRVGKPLSSRVEAMPDKLLTNLCYRTSGGALAWIL